MQPSLERHAHLIDFAISSLLRRKGKNLSLLAVYVLIVFVIASLILFVQALRREASLVLTGAPEIVVQRMVAGRHDLIPVSYGADIVSIRGVSEVVPRFWGYYYDPVFGANYTLMVPDQSPPAEGTIVIGPGVARNQRVKSGDLLTFRGASLQPLLLTVGQILPQQSELVATDLITLSAADFQAMFRLPPGTATDLAVKVANPREVATVAAKIAERFPDTRPITRSEILATYDALFDWRSGMMVVILGTAVLCFIICAWDKATGLSAEERREIGILKSIGCETTDVLLLKFWEGTVISLTAFLAGLSLAYAHVFFFSAGLFQHALKGWAVIYPDFRLTPSLDPYQLGILFFLSVVPFVAATIVPSWLAATTDPDSAMRS